MTRHVHLSADGTTTIVPGDPANCAECVAGTTGAHEQVRLAGEHSRGQHPYLDVAACPVCVFVREGRMR